MATNSKFRDQLEKERGMLDNSNPFAKVKESHGSPDPKDESYSNEIYWEEDIVNKGYFNLILESDHKDIEWVVKGLRKVGKRNVKTGHVRTVIERNPKHFLTEDGAEDILMEIRGHLASDIKLGRLTQNEFLRVQEIIRRSFINYIRNNMEKLGMDTEAKQRKAAPLIVLVLNRIRAVYSRSIEGRENEKSHGDIKLSGRLDEEKEKRFDLEESTN